MEAGKIGLAAICSFCAFSFRCKPRSCGGRLSRGELASSGKRDSHGNQSAASGYADDAVSQQTT